MVQLTNVLALRAIALAQRSVFWLLGNALLVASLSANVHAEKLNFRKLLMPDELGASHQELEKDCGNCHQSFDRAAQSSLCLDCHEKVAEDLQTDNGFHAQLETDRPLNCTSCHTDHRGRNASLTLASHAEFNHALTNFPLEGQHADTSCQACHETGQPRYTAEKTCYSCHTDDDSHDRKLGEACGDCHGAGDWQQSTFDHDITTDFALKGKHAETDCNACHLQQRYVDTPKKCASCHALDDMHRGQHGQQCEDCHSTADWQSIRFDHGAATGYTLKDAHGKIACNACHIGETLEQTTGTECIDCHSDHDIHAGSNGTQCADCHSESGWKNSSFDHAKTDFPLRGVHRTVSCEACHKAPNRQQPPSTQCVDCHRIDDIHRGEQGDTCGRCHNPSSWTDNVVFDHDLTAFPLIGMHAATACELCHIQRPYRVIETACIDCHLGEDVHEQTLGSECQNCHVPNAWPIWQFSHNDATDFTLDGAHTELACNACHTKPLNNARALGSHCDGCHRDDDPHDGEYGKYCDRCHTTDRFDNLDKLQQSVRH